MPVGLSDVPSRRYLHFRLAFISVWPRPHNTHRIEPHIAPAAVTPHQDIERLPHGGVAGVWHRVDNAIHILPQIAQRTSRNRTCHHLVAFFYFEPNIDILVAVYNPFASTAFASSGPHADIQLHAGRLILEGGSIIRWDLFDAAELNCLSQLSMMARALFCDSKYL